MMRQVDVFEPAMCCSTGLCKPNPDPALVQFSADIAWIQARGGTIGRHNLSSDPYAFVSTPVVREFVVMEGQAGLPLTLVDGVTVRAGSYPTRSQLARWTGVETGVELPMAAAEPCCGGDGARTTGTGATGTEPSRTSV